MFEEVEYSEDGPVQRFFGMNWGNNGIGDDTWSLSTGNWYYNGIIFNHRKELLTLENALP